MDPPSAIGPYRLIRRVGRGGMAEVWLARRRGPAGADKPCAVKLPLPHLAAEPRFRRMFLDEARLASRLTHGSVVGTFDVGLAGSRPYLAMEWIDGLDLAALGERMRDAEEPMPVEIAVHIVGELLEALRYAHGFCVAGRPQPIIHRDVSPHNVLVSTGGDVKLLDFGIARGLHEHTSQEFAKGKLRYMAAEQLRGQATERSDLFAVGAVLHELLDGRRFRDDVPPEAMFARILADHVPPLRRRDVPPAIEALRLGLLEPDEAARLPSADAALDELAAWSGYRNRRRDLRRLVAAHLGPGRRPRISGLTEMSGLRAEAAAPRRSITTRTRPSGPVPLATHPASAGDAAQPRRRRRLRRWTVLAASFGLGACPPLAGAGYVAATATERAAETSPEITFDEPTPPPPSLPIVPRMPPRPVAAQPAGPPPAPSPSHRRRARSVTVELRLDFVDWAEVHIGPRRALVDPRASVRVAAGPVTVRWRTAPDAAWSVARVVLHPGRTHQLRIRAREIRVVDFSS